MQVRMTFLVDFDAAKWADHSGQGHPIDNPDDVLSYYLNHFLESEGSRACGMEVLQEKLTIVKAGPKPTNDKSTRAVVRNLYKDHPEGSRYGMVWEMMNPGCLKDFARDAKAWLRDRSELSGDTIDTADWQYVYDSFFGPDGDSPESADRYNKSREERERKDREKEAR